MADTASTAKRAAVAVGPVVEDRRAEAAAHPVPVDLDHVEAEGTGPDGRFAEGGGDPGDLGGGQLGDVGSHCLVEPLPEIVGAQPLGEYAGDALQNGHEVGVGLVELGADHAAVAVGGVDESLVVGGALFGEEVGAEAVPAHRHIAQDDHGAAAGGDGLQFGRLLLFGEAQGGGGEDDPVF